MLQRGSRELREAHAFVTSHPAARDPRVHHLVGALASQLGETPLDAHLLRRARHVDGDGVSHLTRPTGSLSSRVLKGQEVRGRWESRVKHGVTLSYENTCRKNYSQQYGLSTVQVHFCPLIY